MKVLLLAYIDRKRMIDLFFLSEMTHRLNKLRLYWLNFGLKNYLTNQKSNRFSFLFNYYLLRSAKNNNRMPLDSYSWILIFAYVLICTQVFLPSGAFVFPLFFTNTQYEILWILYRRYISQIHSRIHRTVQKQQKMQQGLKLGFSTYKAQCKVKKSAGKERLTDK